VRTAVPASNRSHLSARRPSLRLIALVVVLIGASAVVGWHGHQHVHAGLFVTSGGESRRLSEWRLGSSELADPVVLDAGPAQFSLANTDAVQHSFVLIRTDLEPGELPAGPAGVDLDEAGEVVGTIGDVAPGSSGSSTFDLPPGRYVIVCDTPGHYLEGMYYPLTVR